MRAAIIDIKKIEKEYFLPFRKITFFYIIRAFTCFLSLYENNEYLLGTDSLWKLFVAENKWHIQKTLNQDLKIQKVLDGG